MSPLHARDRQPATLVGLYRAPQRPWQHPVRRSPWRASTAAFTSATVAWGPTSTRWVRSAGTRHQGQAGGQGSVRRDRQQHLASVQPCSPTEHGRVCGGRHTDLSERKSAWLRYSAMTEQCLPRTVRAEPGGAPPRLYLPEGKDLPTSWHSTPPQKAASRSTTRLPLPPSCPVGAPVCLRSSQKRCGPLGRIHTCMHCRLHRSPNSMQLGHPWTLWSGQSLPRQCAWRVLLLVLLRAAVHRIRPASTSTNSRPGAPDQLGGGAVLRQGAAVKRTWLGARVATCA